MRKTKNILFDLGGVILDIDFKLTHRAFENAGVEGFEHLYSQHAASPFFMDFEKGKTGTAAFFDHIRQICGCPLSDGTIRDCWNALLIGFDPAKVERMEELAKHYRIFLFSNTNIIHYQCFSKMFFELKGKDFNTCFEKAWYSHEIGLRKPAPESYQYILRDGSLEAPETLFIDDTARNTDAAALLGFQTHHLSPPQTILDLEL